MKDKINEDDLLEVNSGKLSTAAIVSISVGAALGTIGAISYICAKSHSKPKKVSLAPEDEERIFMNGVKQGIKKRLQRSGVNFEKLENGMISFPDPNNNKNTMLFAPDHAVAAQELNRRLELNDKLRNLNITTTWL